MLTHSATSHVLLRFSSAAEPISSAQEPKLRLELPSVPATSFRPVFACAISSAVYRPIDSRPFVTPVIVKLRLNLHILEGLPFIVKGGHLLSACTL